MQNNIQFLGQTVTISNCLLSFVCLIEYFQGVFQNLFKKTSCQHVYHLLGFCSKIEMSALGLTRLRLALKISAQTHQELYL